MPIWKPDFHPVIKLRSQSGQPSWLAFQLKIAVQFLILPAVQLFEVYTRMKKLPIAKLKNRKNSCFCKGLVPNRALLLFLPLPIVSSERARGQSGLIGQVTTFRVVGPRISNCNWRLNLTAGHDDRLTIDHCISPVELSVLTTCLLYTSPSPRDATLSRMPSSA